MACAEPSIRFLHFFPYLGQKSRFSALTKPKHLFSQKPAFLTRLRKKAILRATDGLQRRLKGGMVLRSTYACPRTPWIGMFDRNDINFFYLCSFEAGIDNERNIRLLLKNPFPHTY